MVTGKVNVLRLIVKLKPDLGRGFLFATSGNHRISAFNNGGMTKETTRKPIMARGRGGSNRRACRLARPSAKELIDDVIKS